MFVHMAQVHKVVCTVVPNALKGRDSGEIEVYGMEGIPLEDLMKHEANPEGNASSTSNVAGGASNRLHQFFQSGEVANDTSNLWMPSSTSPSMFAASPTIPYYSTNPIYSTLLSNTNNYKITFNEDLNQSANSSANTSTSSSATASAKISFKNTPTMTSLPFKAPLSFSTSFKTPAPSRLAFQIPHDTSPVISLYFRVYITIIYYF